MSEKSFIQNVVNFLFLRPRGTKKKRNISPQEAIALQKKYVADFCEVGLPYEVPYVEIAKQLFSEKETVFEAAVYYLTRIAQNKKETAEPIAAILQSYMEKCKNTTRQEIVAAVMENMTVTSNH